MPERAAHFSDNELGMGATTLKNSDLKLSIPRADVLHLMEALPAALQNLQNSLAGTPSQEIKAEQETSLLAGGAAMSSIVNGQKLGFNSEWSIENKASGLLFSLDKLAVAADNAGISGNLSAELPHVLEKAADGSIAEMLGIPLPAVRGSLKINISQWKPLAEILHANISGTPFNAALTFDFDKTQSAGLDASLAKFSVRDKTQAISLDGFRTAMKASDLWGSPLISINMNLSELKADQLSVNSASANVSGGLNDAAFSFVSKGDILAEISGKWKPGELSLQKLSAQALPALLGLDGKTPLGFRLEKAASIKYSADSVSTSGLNVSFLPAGKLAVSGSASPGKMDMKAALSSLDLDKFQAILPEIPKGNIAFNTRLTGSPIAPAGDFDLHLRNIKATDAVPAVSANIGGKFRPAAKSRMLDIKVMLEEQTKKSFGLEKADIAAAIPFTAPASGFALPDLDAPLQAHLSLRGKLDTLWKLVPVSDQKMSGIAAIDASVRGKASSPVVDASVLLDEGRFIDIAQGLELRSMKLKADARQVQPLAQQGKVDIDFSARDTKQGTLGLKGSVDLTTMNVAINGAIKSLAPLHRQDINAVLSGSLGVKGNAANPSVIADITVDKGRIELIKLPGGDITELEIYRPEDEKQKKTGEASPGNLDVHVRIPNQFFIRGYGLDCEWKGDIYVKGPMNRPAVTGGLQAVRGTLDILSKNFKLAEGEVRFDGGWPVSPLLNIDMEYQAANITADIIVGGTASNPKLTLTSKPVMPNDEILSQVLFGQSSGSLSHVQALQMASAAATLAGFGDADVMGKGRKALGVDVFKLNSDNDGKDSDVSRTSLEMGTYIRDDIYVGMEQGVGKSSDTGAVVEIELLPGLGAQAKTFSNKSEFGLKWKKNY